MASCKILNYKLEAVLETPERGVAIRREMLSPKLPINSALACLPYKDYDYSKVLVAYTYLKGPILYQPSDPYFSSLHKRRRLFSFLGNSFTDQRHIVEYILHNMRPFKCIVSFIVINEHLFFSVQVV